ncbi:hypothetical protein [Aliarcobacter butzleri]|uniref:hypothetical protein n=1 Tax=Aliarcobacter butzleri TaxID=28197 RepID=UPI00125FB498|nr:hypothetical protein [Aliarcobacter butzleri]
MAQPKLKCDNISLFRDTLNLINGITSENKPNGCIMSKTPKGLVVNTYDTGAVVFQGNEENAKEEKEKILKVIEGINKKSSPQ